MNICHILRIFCVEYDIYSPHRQEFGVMFQSAAVSPRRMNPQPAEKGVRNSRSVLRLNMSAGQVPVPAREAHASVGAAASELRRQRRRGGAAASVPLRPAPGAFSKRTCPKVSPEPKFSTDCPRLWREPAHSCAERRGKQGIKYNYYEWMVQKRIIFCTP